MRNHILLSLLLISTLSLLLAAFLIVGTQEACGQANSTSSCCPCPGELPSFNGANSPISIDTNPNFNKGNANILVPIVKKKFSLPAAPPELAPLLKTVLDERSSGRQYVTDEYFGIRIGNTSFYFRETKDAILSVPKLRPDAASARKPICGRYAITEEFPTNVHQEQIANGGRLWRKFGSRWEVLLYELDYVVSPEIYPLIMTRSERACLGLSNARGSERPAVMTASTLNRQRRG